MKKTSKKIKKIKEVESKVKIIEKPKEQISDLEEEIEKSDTEIFFRRTSKNEDSTLEQSEIIERTPRQIFDPEEEEEPEFRATYSTSNPGDSLYQQTTYSTDNSTNYVPTIGIEKESTERVNRATDPFESRERGEHGRSENNYIGQNDTINNFKKRHKNL